MNALLPLASVPAQLDPSTPIRDTVQKFCIDLVNGRPTLDDRRVPATLEATGDPQLRDTARVMRGALELIGDPDLSCFSSESLLAALLPIGLSYIPAESPLGVDRARLARLWLRSS